MLFLDDRLEVMVRLQQQEDATSIAVRTQLGIEHFRMNTLDERILAAMREMDLTDQEIQQYVGNSIPGTLTP